MPPAETQLHHYSAFGLTIASELVLDGLVPLPGEESVQVDVVIRNGEVPEDENARGPVFHRLAIGPESFYLSVENLARFRLCNGEEITVQRCCGKTDSEVNAYLQCSVFGAMFHQRGMLPLHASAIKVGGRCVLFTGPSGAGKSTTAAEFLKRGYPLHADDLSVVRFDRKSRDGLPLVYPASPQMKLWSDSMEKAEVDGCDCRKLFADKDKYAVIRDDAYNSEPLPIGKIYVISPQSDDCTCVEDVHGADKFEMLALCTYRFGFIARMGRLAEHFRAIGAISGKLALACVRRPRDFDRIGEMADVIERDFLGCGF